MLPLSFDATYANIKLAKEEQFEVATVCTMTQSIQAILTPLLIISYIFGLRIANLPVGHTRLWFSFLYVLIVWGIYYFLLTSALIPSFFKFYPIEYYICYLLELFTTLLSIVFGIYHDKKFKSCLKKLDIVDNTLLELETVIDYGKLRMKTLWFVLGWVITVILVNCSTALFLKIEFGCDIVTAILFIFLLNYSFHINVIDDLITAKIIGYIELKFDQINELLQNLTKYNKHEIKEGWENPVTQSHQRRFLKTLGSKYIVWIVIHLHLELHKISRDVDAIFGTQMTFKMACYFSWIAIDLHIIFCTIFINDYVNSNKILCTILYLFLFSHNVCKFLLINYVCETATTKAKTTGDLINRLSHSTFEVEVHEIISQFSLQMANAPLKFCGIGLFQFGFKFLYRFAMSIATVVVIIIQSHVHN